MNLPDPRTITPEIYAEHSFEEAGRMFEERHGSSMPDPMNWPNEEIKALMKDAFLAGMLAARIQGR